MDAVHFHLMLTHFPIVGTIIGTFILAYGIYSDNIAVKKVGLFTFIGMAIVTIPVFLSGEEAEEAVEHLAGVSEKIIEEHEELAEKAIWLMGLLGLFSMFSIYAIIRKLSISKTVIILTLIISFITFGLFVKVGNLGGQIRHTEIRKNFKDTQTMEHSKKDISNEIKDNDAQNKEDNDAYHNEDKD